MRHFIRKRSSKFCPGHFDLASNFKAGLFFPQNSQTDGSESHKRYILVQHGHESPGVTSLSIVIWKKGFSEQQELQTHIKQFFNSDQILMKNVNFFI